MKSLKKDSKLWHNIDSTSLLEGIMLNKAGLVSVTFRKLDVAEILEIAKKAGLAGIEWGSDVHVPVGDLEKATYVNKQSKAANIETVAYGSYYKAASENEHSFEEVLDTAVELGALAIRIWAGNKGSERTSEAERAEVVADIQAIADLAAAENVEIHIEYHGATLTDTPESAVQLMEAINHPNVFLYWQPAVGISKEAKLDSIDKIKPWLKNVHVFYWDFIFRLPLAEGKAQWQAFVDQIGTQEEDRYFMLEFVQDESVDQFYDDAEILKDIL